VQHIVVIWQALAKPINSRTCNVMQPPASMHATASCATHRECIHCIYPAGLGTLLTARQHSPAVGGTGYTNSMCCGGPASFQTWQNV